MKDENIQLPLTPLQSRVMMFIYRFLGENRYPPTVTEIQENLHISNPGSVHRILTALKKKNYLIREKHVSRGIRLIPLARRVCARDQQLNLELNTINSNP
mgnify:CR=1 FL=1